MKKVFLTSFLISISSVYLSANTLFKPCIGCHGENGEKSALNRSKIINQMSRAEIIEALNGYKNNTYGGPMKGLMKVQVKKLTEEEIELLAKSITDR